MSKIYTVFILLLCSVTMNAQTYTSLEGGYYNNPKKEGLHMLVGIDQYFGNIGFSLRYRNMTPEQYYEDRAHYDLLRSGTFVVNMLGGTSYRYDSGYFHPMVGLNTYYRVHGLVEMSLGVDHIMGGLDNSSINIGVRVRMVPNKDRDKVRFF